jgi:type VI secretion system secreted protein Hcp
MKLHAIHRFTAFIILCLLPASQLQAAPPVYAYLTANGNAIDGGVTQPGNAGSISTLGFDHEIVMERDAATGQLTGRRLHKPIRIVKAIDKSTPVLYKAMTENQVIAGQFRFWTPVVGGGGGQLQQYYTVSITGGRVTGIRDWKTNTRDLSADRAGDLEEVTFTYTTITWTWVDGGITHTDTWNGNQ